MTSKALSFPYLQELNLQGFEGADEAKIENFYSIAASLKEAGDNKKALIEQVEWLYNIAKNPITPNTNIFRELGMVLVRGFSSPNDEKYLALYHLLSDELLGIGAICGELIEVAKDEKVERKQKFKEHAKKYFADESKKQHWLESRGVSRTKSEIREIFAEIKERQR